MNKQQLQQEIEALQKQLEEKQKALAAMPEKWEPNGGEWWVTHYGSIESGLSTGGSKCFGAEYATRQQAEKAAKAMRAHNRLLAYVAEFAPDYEPDWSCEQNNYTVCFNRLLGKFDCVPFVTKDVVGAVFMPEHVAEELAAKLNSGEVEL